VLATPGPIVGAHPSSKDHTIFLLASTFLFLGFSIAYKNGITVSLFKILPLFPPLANFFFSITSALGSTPP
jgi:hypothetical protein